MSDPDVFIEPKALTEFICKIFARTGSNEAEAKAIATSLVETSLMGHDSHGVSILPRYVDRVLKGLIEPNQNITVVKNDGPALIIDGNRVPIQLKALSTSPDADDDSDSDDDDEEEPEGEQPTHFFSLRERWRALDTSRRQRRRPSSSSTSPNRPAPACEPCSRTTRRGWG